MKRFLRVSQCHVDAMLVGHLKVGLLGICWDRSLQNAKQVPSCNIVVDTPYPPDYIGAQSSVSFVSRIP